MSWNIRTIDHDLKTTIATKSWVVRDGCVFFYDEYDAKGNLVCMIPLSNISSIIWED